MQKRLSELEADVQDWSRQAQTQLYLSVAVGLLGLVVGLLQRSAANWTRALTVVFGFLISAMTLLGHTIYQADYKTLTRAVFEAKPIIADLEEYLGSFDSTQSEQNQKTTEEEFKAKCGKIDQIGYKVLGFDPDPQKPQNSENKSSMFGGSGVVYAQSQPQAPTWTKTKIQSDKFSTFFVGSDDDKSLSLARAASYDNGVIVGAHWLKDNRPGDSQISPSPQLLELIKHVAEISDTWYSYDRTTGIYRYYTQLRLTNEFRAGSVENSPSVLPPTTFRDPVTVMLNNDSASEVPNAGLILLLKHMGFDPLTAELYVVSGKPDDTEVIQPYSKNRALADKYVAKFKGSLTSCKGGHARIDGYTVWCFHIEGLQIKSKTHKAQHLGTVTGDGGNRFEVLAVKLDHNVPFVQVQVRAAN